MSSATSDAQRLKEEGNALFGKKQFKQALAKYSNAIELDGTNAVLFANRAACLLGLRKYIDAAQDAKKATELDPTYAKGWARLASAQEEIGSWLDVLDSWKRAIDAFPSDSELSAVDEKQRSLYEDNLRKAQAKLERKREELQTSATVVTNATDGDKMPWQRAEKLIDELTKSENPNSSAWVILSAHESWKEGIQGMNKLKKSIRNGQVQMTGQTRVFESFCEGVMRDSRVFHIAQEDFSSRYNDQVQYEVMTRKAWVEGDSKTILNAAADRLRLETWDTVRPALAVTVRGFIMRGFFSHSMNQDSGAAVTFYTTCIEIVEGGMRKWPTVSPDEKGAMFCRSFIRGIKVLRLEAFMAAYKTSAKKFPLEKLQEYAKDLLVDAQSDQYPDLELDPGSLLCYWQYPKGEARAASGFCTAERGMRCTVLQEGILLWTTAGKFYEEASTVYPDDDEKKCWFLNSAVSAYKNARAPLSTILPLLVTMKESFPKMKKIWEYSPLAVQGGHRIIEKTLRMEQELQRKLANGSISLGSTL